MILRPPKGYKLRPFENNSCGYFPTSFFMFELLDSPEE